MGAVTCLLHGDRDPTIGGMVLDSPFSNMKTLVKELAKTEVNVPGFLLSIALSAVARSVKSRAHFDLDKLSPIDHVEKCYIPAMFATGKHDHFIPPHHTKALFNKYAGDKELIMFDGDHNDNRPESFFNDAVFFFQEKLQVAKVCSKENKMSEEDRKPFLERLRDRSLSEQEKQRADLERVKKDAFMDPFNV